MIRNRPRYYIWKNDQAMPVDVLTWVRWRNSERVDVGKWRCASPFPDSDEILVSTIFLGLDHQYGDGPPALWDTRIFGFPGDHELSEYQERYTSRDDALAGHHAAIDVVKAALATHAPPGREDGA